MTEPRMLRDILAQPESLGCALRLHSGDGRANLKQAAALVRSAERVLVTGMGASLSAATPLYYRLAALGIHASIVESGELLHYLADLCKGSAVIAVSRSGESAEVVKLLPQLKRLGCPLVGVTEESASSLAREADCTVALGSLRDEIIAIQSYTGTVLALHLLAAEVAGDFDAAHDETARLIATLPEYIAAGVEAISDWDGFLDCTPIHLLARGPSSASATEGALLFGETAKAAAVPVLAGTFRHGHVETVDPTFRALLFAPPGKTRSLNLGLARDIERFGGLLRVIASPAADEYLSPLVEIIPVQIAALRLSQLRGITAGVFRFGPQVTRDEESFG